MEVNEKSKFRSHSIREYSRIKEYITRSFDTESAKINSIAIIIGLLTGLVIGVYERALQYFNTLFGMQRGFSVHEFPPYYVIFMPALGGLIVGIISYFLIKKRYGVDGLIETVALRGARLNLLDSFLEVFASIITISSGGSLGKRGSWNSGWSWDRSFCRTNSEKSGKAAPDSSWLWGCWWNRCSISTLRLQVWSLS